MQPDQRLAGGLAAVARGVQVVELEIAAGCQREAGGEEHPAVHHGQEQRRFGGIGVGGAHLGGDAGDGGIDGRTVMEIDARGKSAAEVAALWTYVSDRLEKNFRRTVFAAPNTTGFTAARPAAGFGRRVVS